MAKRNRFDKQKKLRQKERALEATAQAKQAEQDEKLQILKTLPISAWDYPRPVVAVLQERAMSYASDVFYQFWGIAQQGTPILKIPYGRTDQVRNKIGELMLEYPKFTHVLMLDVDHIHDTHILQRLLKWILLYPDIWIVGGLNFRRSAPYDPCGFIEGADGNFYPPQEWEQGLLQVDAVGTGSLLLDKRVFLELEPPWFFNDYSRVWEGIWPGEDMGFSRKCREHGLNMFMDTTCTSPHITTGAVDESSYRQYILDHNTQGTPIENFEAKRSLANDRQV